MKSHWKNNPFKNIKIIANDKQLKVDNDKSKERRKDKVMRKLDSILERDLAITSKEEKAKVLEELRKTDNVVVKAIMVVAEVISRLLVNVRTNQVLIGRKLGVPEHQRGYKRPEREVRDTDK